MSEENKSLVIEFVRRLADKRAADAFSLLSEDAKWWYQPSLEGGGGSGAAKTTMLQNLAGMFESIVGPFHLDVVGMTAEGERVAAELVGGGAVKGGTTYANTYHMLFLVRDGKIAGVREYCDTAASFKLLQQLSGIPVQS